MNSCNLKVSTSTAKNGMIVPIINGIHLHSAYDPEKEAKSLVQANLEKMNENPRALILGLGFSYHVHEIYNFLSQKHKDFEMVVIEPNNNTTISCCENGLIEEMENITIYSGKKINGLFNEEKFIHFLLHKPALIQHSPSFNLYREYFEALLTFNASEEVIDIYNAIEDNNLKSKFSDFTEGDSIFEAMNNLDFDKFKNKENYFFWKSLSGIIETSTKGKLEQA